MVGALVGGRDRGGQHVPAAKPLLLPLLLQAALQQSQLPVHHLPHGGLQLEDLLQVGLGFRLIPHLGVSPGPQVVGLHDACREDQAGPSSQPQRQPSPTRPYQLTKSLTLTVILNLSVPPELVSSTVKWGWGGGRG